MRDLGEMVSWGIFLICVVAAMIGLAPRGVAAGKLAVTPETRLPMESVLHAQTAYGLEWWYVTGQLSAEKGEYGFEFAFFRVSARAAEGGGSFSTDNVYMAHVGLTDVGQRGFSWAERSSRGAFEEAGALDDRFRVWMRDWELTEDEPGRFRLRASADNRILELVFRPVKAPVLNGLHGYSRKGDDPAEASYYVSWTRLETFGSLSLEGEPAVRLSGEAWMDREISTPVADPQVKGWDWFSIQLDDGSEIMLYRILGPDGKVSRWSAGTVVSPDGTALGLGIEAFSLEPLRSWTSPDTGVTYDTRWEITIPGTSTRLTVEAVLDGQELVTVRSTGNAYWEGKCRVAGTHGGGSVSGNAYLEMNRWSLREVSTGKP